MENEIEKELSDIIDGWMNDLINKLKSGSGSTPQRGLWDRFKGSIANLFYGRTGDRAKKNNPYYWQNRFGDDLGSEVKEWLTLEDYLKLRSIIDGFETDLQNKILLLEGGENLRIWWFLRKAAEDLKQKLLPVLSKYAGNVVANPEPKTANKDDTSAPTGSKKINIDRKRPAAVDSAADKPAAKPATGKPAAKPAAEKPAAEKPAAEKPAAEKPAAEKPAAEKPAAEKPAAEKPAAEKPAAKPEDEPAEPVDDFERAKLQMNNFYMGLDDKEKIIKSVQINVIKPIFDKLSPRKKKELNFGWGRIQRSLPHNIDELKSYLDVHLLDKLSEIIDRKQKEILEMLGLMSEDS